MTDNLVGRMKASVTYEYMPMKVRRQLSEAAARIEALEAALSLALGFLIEDEPGDSRLVSDEFVAMAVILEGDDDAGCLPIIQAAIAARKAKDHPHAD